MIRKKVTLILYNVSYCYNKIWINPKCAEGKLAAEREQTMYAQEETWEWKLKYDVDIREAKSAIEEAVAVQHRSNIQKQQQI